MSVGDYAQILLRLHEILESSIVKARREGQAVGARSMRLDEITNNFTSEGEKYLATLPQEPRGDAPITLRDYGRRNMESITSRIRNGDFSKLEDV
jgi:hypothetical protein